MPKLLAILCGIILGLVILLKGISLIQLSILLLPAYFSGRNLFHQSRADGNWTMRWPKFWQAFISELVFIVVPATVIFIGESYHDISVLLGLAAYIIVTAFAYGAVKKHDCREQQECPKN